jgi:amino acid transporter
MTTLTALAAQLTVLLKDDQKPHSPGTEAAINIAFIALTTFSHCLGVKVSQWSIYRRHAAYFFLAIR